MLRKLAAFILTVTLSAGLALPVTAESPGLLMADRETSTGRSVTLTMGKSRDLNDYVPRKSQPNEAQAWYLIGNTRWSSSNPDAASVNEKGVAAAHKVGVARITAVSWDNLGKQRVSTVIVGVKRAGQSTVKRSSFELCQGTWLDLRQLAQLDSGSRELKWATDDGDIASVDKNGLITAKSVGRTIISASYTGENGKSEKIKYQIRVTYSSLLFQTRESTVILKKGYKLDLGEMFYPNYSEMPSVMSEYKCASGDKSILTASGMSITGKSAGTARAEIRRGQGSDEEIPHRITFIVR